MPRACLRKLRIPRSRASESQAAKEEWLREAGSGCGCASARTSERPTAFLLQPAAQAGPGGWAACWSAVRPTRATHIRTKAAATAPALLAFMIAPFMMQARIFLVLLFVV